MSSGPPQEQPGFGRFLRFLGRALILRCPNCGRGHPMQHWFKMNERCEVCGAWYEREEGYFLGSFAINLVVSELVPTAAAVLLLVITWPNPPWRLVQIAAPVAMGAFPFLFFPFSRVIWLALDWNFNAPPMEARPSQPRPGNYSRPA